MNGSLAPLTGTRMRAHGVQSAVLVRARTMVSDDLDLVSDAPDADDGAPGALDVLGNAEYNPHYADAAENLMDLASVHQS